jgi:hypothetical protein
MMVSSKMIDGGRRGALLLESELVLEAPLVEDVLVELAEDGFVARKSVNHSSRSSVSIFFFFSSI